jgi:hypothetical protein
VFFCLSVESDVRFTFFFFQKFIFIFIRNKKRKFLFSVDCTTHATQDSSALRLTLLGARSTVIRVFFPGSSIGFSFWGQSKKGPSETFEKVF